MAPEPVAGIDASDDRKPSRDSGIGKAFGGGAEWKTPGRNGVQSILEPGHAFDEVGLGRFENPVVMVVHQDPRIGLELRQGAGLGQGFREKFAVGVVEDDCLAVNATPRSAVGKNAKRNRVGCSAADSREP